MRTVIISILLLLLDANITRSQYVCEEDPTEQCSKPLLHITDAVNNWNETCSPVVDYIDCLEQYEKDCPQGYVIVFFVPFDSSMNYRLIRELCDDSSRLHSEYTKHAPCIQSILESDLQKCENDTEGRATEYYEFLQGKLLNDELDIETIRRDYMVQPPCLFYIYTSVCVFSKIESSCGARALAVSKEIMQKSSFSLQFCHYKDFRNLKTRFLEFQEDTDESEFVKGILNSEALLEFLNDEKKSKLL